MSRIGKLPVEIPSTVKAAVNNNVVKIQGPKGELERSFNNSVKVILEESLIRVEKANNSRLAKAMYGTARSIINGMVQGVVNGYTKDLEISGVGFRATLTGDIIDLNLGYSHPVNQKVPEGITVKIDGGTKIKIEGADKQKVGQLAASIKNYYPVEPYKQKGVKIVGEFVRKKEGKKTS